MISYRRRGMYFLANILKRKGSVFGIGFSIAAPCSCLTVLVTFLSTEGYIEIGSPESTAWNGFFGLMGFLIVFRTSQAYARFWEGCSATTKMRSQWYTACGSAISFSNCSTLESSAVAQFQVKLVRLFSLLHMLALAEIEDTNHDNPGMIDAFRYEVIDLKSLGEEGMKALVRSDSKVELVFQWIQQLIASNVQSGVLDFPAPIVSRVFQELGNGMVQFHEALKLSSTPFPFPYAQICDCLLIMHWVLTPCVMSQWAPNLFWAATLSFVQSFTLWSLNSIAVELENPFGTDPNDIDAHAMQLEFNRHMMLLVDTELSKVPEMVFAESGGNVVESVKRKSSFYEASGTDSGAQTTIVRSGRTNDKEISHQFSQSSSYQRIGRRARLVRSTSIARTRFNSALRSVSGRLATSSTTSERGAAARGGRVSPTSSRNLCQAGGRASPNELAGTGSEMNFEI